MARTRIFLTIDRRVLSRLDRGVRHGLAASRSQAIEAALREKLTRFQRRRLAAECAKLDPVAEQALADQGLNEIVAV